jgi:hypothetical protein
MREARCIVGLKVALISTFVLFCVNEAPALDNPEKVIEETSARDWSHNSSMRAACIEQR